MNNFSVRLFTLAALVCGVFFLTNCSSTPTTGGNNSAVVVNKTTDAPKTTTASTDSVGVAECDEYIQKYEACINSKVPEAQRATYKSSFETLRKSWKDAAANPQSKAGLATGCKQALETAKQSFSSYGCAW
ncbi:MAG TPA: hypothetical protein VGC97_00735 [Pyrinomonadaceae bacterium]